MRRRTIAKPIREAVFHRAQGRCEACGVRLDDLWECHHRRLRSQGGRDELPNLLALCLPCHIKAHSQRAEFGEPRGFIVPSWQSPAQTPVTLWDDRFVFLSASYEPLPQGEAS